MTTPFHIEPYDEDEFAGTLTTYTYEVEEDGTTEEPETNFRTNENWGVHITLNMSGYLLNDLLEEFRVRFFLENLTPDETDYEFPVPPILLVPMVRGQLTYDLEIPISAGTVVPGIYVPTVYVQVYETNGGPPWPMAAYEALPIINMYEYPGPIIN